MSNYELSLSYPCWSSLSILRSSLNPKQHPKNIYKVCSGRYSVLQYHANKSAVRLHLRHGGSSQLLKHPRDIKNHPVAGAFPSTILKILLAVTWIVSPVGAIPIMAPDSFAADLETHGNPIPFGKAIFDRNLAGSIPSTGAHGGLSLAKGCVSS